ncbi:MAG: hypothetical protein IKP72_00915 [Clostridia bacterium]|nr:hypothetical protein [Clostridia bacterium]
MEFYIVFLKEQCNSLLPLFYIKRHTPLSTLLSDLKCSFRQLDIRIVVLRQFAWTRSALQRYNGAEQREGGKHYARKLCNAGNLASADHRLLYRPVFLPSHAQQAVCAADFRHGQRDIGVCPCVHRRKLGKHGSRQLLDHMLFGFSHSAGYFAKPAAEGVHRPSGRGRKEPEKTEKEHPKKLISSK